MTEEARFEAILRELAELMLDLGDQGRSAVLIGGQVLAIHSRAAGGSGAIDVETDTGVVVRRGFSMEPDLLFDLSENDFMLERLPEVLRQRGYQRVRDFRWSRPLGGVPGLTMELDLFASPDVAVDHLPTGMTALPDAELTLKRKVRVELLLDQLTLRINVPDPVAFLAMKLRAKLEQRPQDTKDSFDIYAYVKHVGLEKVNAALLDAGKIGGDLKDKLLQIFWNREAPGVHDVLEYAEGLSQEEKDLLACDVVDLFCDLR